MTTPASPSPAAQPPPDPAQPDPAQPDPAQPGPAPARRGWGAVSIVLVGAFMALLDVTIVNVALPSIRTGLHASSASLEWIVSGYALSYGLALVPGGRAGDRFGPKRLFLIGLTIFTLASVGCGIAQDQVQLVAARIVQGLGAGLFFPAISATIQHTFTGPARSRAFGLLGAVIGVSTAIGPLLGGVIIAAAGASDGWRWVFLVNLFVGAVGHSDGRLAAAHHDGAHPAELRPGRARAADRRAAAPAHPAGARAGRMAGRPGPGSRSAAA